MFGSDDNFDVIMNLTGVIARSIENLEVVPDGRSTTKDRQIGLSEAKEIDPECVKSGKTCRSMIFFEKFGRRAIPEPSPDLAAQKSFDLQKEAVSKKFEQLVVRRIPQARFIRCGSEALCIDEEQNEPSTPKDEQYLPSDSFHKVRYGQAVVKRVDNLNNNPKVIATRTDESFLRRLLSRRCLKIHDGLITIRACGPASPASVPRLRLKAMTTVSTLWAHAWNKGKPYPRNCQRAPQREYR